MTEVIAERFADGGHVVARLDGRVVFVRGGLPGERLHIVITDRTRDSHWFADVVEVLEPHPGRVPPRCPVAVPGGCGGCAWQHADEVTQLEAKGFLVAEQLRRLAGVVWDGCVEAVEPRWGWRTRMTHHRTDDGRWGLRRHRSHDVVPLPEQGCAIAAEEAGPDAVGAQGSTRQVGERRWWVPAGSFWQVHPQAPAVLGEAVLSGLGDVTGMRAWDLFCGVGLFAGMLHDAGAAVWGVDGSRTAIDAARRNVPEARFGAGDVATAVRRQRTAAEVVVADPPRAGLGRDLVRELIRRPPLTMAYVSCNPATLASNLSRLLAADWQLDGVRAFDLFPQTEHVECVAILRPGQG